MKRSSQTYVGTSGWQYKHWKGVFYPEDIKEADELSVYAQTFHTVEINNSFYHLPPPERFRDWKAVTPSAFIFAIKGSRYITHMKKLQVDAEPIHKLISNAAHLKTKTGPILWQLPPRWKINPDRLQSFLTLLPQKYRYAFEFRDPSWWAPSIYALLKQYNCAFCIYELSGQLSPMEVTADWVYIRLHGPDGKYQGKYSTTALRKWAYRCQHWNKEKKDVYIYFDNDQQGFAAENARKLQDMLSHR
ncbi:MAG: DUF72 domain-containing protein [Chitinophaga sp.]|uniref:DUF72 domain-containing protein n=1 Tax=Chitinophaga sp. TaxID=1869181 RepID=UPI0025C44869|nr:DUF72 domain-containing protein [Chitinophaga sp.]MBV8251806.1 DUF72 domain-containing protein [Chitinophaga sp.]